MKVVKFANCIDPDEPAYDEFLHLDLLSSPCGLWTLAWVKQFMKFCRLKICYLLYWLFKNYSECTYMYFMMYTDVSECVKIGFHITPTHRLYAIIRDGMGTMVLSFIWETWGVCVSVGGGDGIKIATQALVTKVCIGSHWYVYNVHRSYCSCVHIKLIYNCTWIIKHCCYCWGMVL